MNILIVHNQYSAPSGEEHALRDIAGLLEENGHQVNWFLRSSSSIRDVSGKVRAFFSGFHSPNAVRTMRHFLERHAVDVALVQNLYPFLSPSILPVFKEFGIPVVMRCPNYRLFCPNGLHLSHGEICERCLGGREYWCLLKNCENDPLKSTGYTLRSMAARTTRRIVNYVDQFVVLTDFQCRRFMAAGIAAENIKVAPNIAPAIDIDPQGEPGSLVSFVGRISQEKGIVDFVTAAARLPEIPFAVAGNFERMADLVRMAPANVRWKGFLKGQALEDFFARSRVLVFPSKCFEGFPNVITRAMVHAKPVIANRLGGIPEIVVEGSTGLLCEPGNLAELCDKITSLYCNPSRCMQLGLSGRAKAEAEYSPYVIYKKLMTVFEAAVQPKLSLDAI